jgi:dUTPase
MRPRIRSNNTKVEDTYFEHADNIIYNLYSNEDVLIKRDKYAPVNTGVFMFLPIGVHARLAPCLKHKHSLSLSSVAINQTDEEEIKVYIFNHENKDIKINSGDKIAELILNTVEPRWYHASKL